MVNDILGMSPVTLRAALAAELEKALKTICNSAAEVRNWVVCHAAAGSQGFNLIDYAAISEIYIGCGLAEWKTAA